MLIICEGIMYAINLVGALLRKPELSNPDKLVYSGHIYTFEYEILLKLYKIKTFLLTVHVTSAIVSDLPFTLYKSVMHSLQTFVADAGNYFC